MNYDEFKSNYGTQVSEIIKDDTCVVLGTEQWMDLLQEIWDGKDPYIHEPSHDEMVRVGLLGMYLGELNVELI
jgi:hypothetical protein